MHLRSTTTIAVAALLTASAGAEAPLIAVKAGRLLDPETGTIATDQTILVAGERIKAVGAGVEAPRDAQVIDLGDLVALPGLVGAHTHLALTYWENKVLLTFSTDMDYWNERMKDEKTGDWMSRGQLTIDFLRTWKAAGIPSRDALLALTINGYRAAGVLAERGPINPGSYADFIAVAGNPLDDLDALRDVRFVTKNGAVFKRDGVMAPERFFHAGPVRGWRTR